MSALPRPRKARSTAPQADAVRRCVRSRYVQVLCYTGEVFKTLPGGVVNTVNILLGVLLVTASVLCAVAIWALTESVKTARSVSRLADDLDVRAIPLLDKADVTIDAINAELLRMDAIVTRVEEITDRVDSTSRTVQGVANAPGEIVTDIAERVRRAWRRRQTESAAARAESTDDPTSGPEESASGEEESP
jgi:hypothetical protein